MLGKRVRLRREGLVEVVDLEADVTAHPAPEALLLERVVDERLLALAHELARVEADAAEKVTTGGCHLHVVENGHLERLAGDGVDAAGHVELERLVPGRVDC